MARPFLEDPLESRQDYLTARGIFLNLAPVRFEALHEGHPQFPIVRFSSNRSHICLEINSRRPLRVKFLRGPVPDQEVCRFADAPVIKGSTVRSRD